MMKGISDLLPISPFSSHHKPPQSILEVMLLTQRINLEPPRAGTEINMFVFVVEVRKGKEYQPHRWSGRREGVGGERWEGGVGMWRSFIPWIRAFNGARQCVTK